MLHSRVFSNGRVEFLRIISNAPERLNILRDLKALRWLLFHGVSAQVSADVSATALSTIAGIIVAKLCVIKSATRR